MTDEVIVRLKIVSDLRTPEEITEALGVECSKSWRKGDKRANTVIVEKHNGWLLDSALPRSAPLESHIDSLLKRLSPHVEKIKKLSRNDDVELSCVVYASSPPPLNFPKPMIHQLGEMGASLDVDLYVMGEKSDLAENPSAVPHKR